MTLTTPTAKLDAGSQENSDAAQNPPSWSSLHLPALDGLRGLAIVLVIAHNFDILELPLTAAGRLFDFMLNVGWIGVQLFFVLSGFLITRILLQTKQSPNYYSAFFGRRVLRIFPLYYGVLFVTFVVFPLLDKVSAELARDQANQIWLWLYLSNWSQPLNIGSQVLPHFWSLAIEEQFYLLWPLLVHRRSPRQVLGLCLAVVVISPGLRVGMLWQDVRPEFIYAYTICRMDALALGAAVAALLQFPGLARRLFARRDSLVRGALFIWITGLILTHGYPRTSPLGQTLGYSCLAVVFAMIVFAVALGGQSGDNLSMWERILNAEFLRTLGKYSYAMYVFHKPLHDWIGRPLLAHFGLLNRNSYVVAIGYVLITIIVTLAAAVLSFHLFEKHFLAMKRWFVARVPTVPGPTISDV